MAKSKKVPSVSVRAPDVDSYAELLPDLSFEVLPTLAYKTKAEKRAAMEFSKSHGLWNGDGGLEDRYRALLEEGVRPGSLCWQRAAAALLEDIRLGVVKVKGAKKASDASTIAYLMRLGESRRSIPRDELRWVVTNLPRKWGEIEESGVPSDYAVSLLDLFKKFPAEAIRMVGSKLIPSKLEDEGDKAFHDDGRADELLSEQIKALSE